MPHAESPQSAPYRAENDPLETSRIQARLMDRDHRRAGLDPLNQVRASDLQPYTGLGYLSRLFRLIAILLLVLLVAEVGVGLYAEGTASLRTLITEASRLIVVAGVLWGMGDLATLLIDVGHDVRATRILLGRHGTHGDGFADFPHETTPLAGAAHGAHGAHPPFPDRSHDRAAERRGAPHGDGPSAAG